MTRAQVEGMAVRPMRLRAKRVDGYAAQLTGEEEVFMCVDVCAYMRVDVCTHMCVSTIGRVDGYAAPSPTLSPTHPVPRAY
jgi:hypothetical protein